MRQAIEFDEFEAVCGVRGVLDDLCGADAPESVDRVVPGGWLPCTRPTGHAGEHVAAHTDGRMLARWERVA